MNTTTLKNIHLLSEENKTRLNNLLTELQSSGTQNKELKRWISYFLASLTDSSLELKPLFDYLITHKMTGKMQGFQSLSTSALENAFCKSYRIQGNNCICSHCYSVRQLKRYKTLRLKLAFSTIVLTEKIYQVKDFPIINTLKFRLESFGDLNNSIQVMNYFTFTTANSDSTITLFSKNPFIIKQAIEKYNVIKPENMIIIYSIKLINCKLTSQDIKHIFELYPFIDKLFIVVNNDGIKKEWLLDKRAIPCLKACEDCPRNNSCYNLGYNKEKFIIIEDLK